MNFDENIHGASGREKTESVPAQPSLRRSKRAAAKAADEDVPSAQAIRSPVEEVAAKQSDAVHKDGTDTDGSASAGSDTDDDDDAELDAFEEDTREAVDSFEAAVAEPAAFLQPSEEISHLARRAAKVIFCTRAAPQNRV